MIISTKTRDFLTNMYYVLWIFVMIMIFLYFFKQNKEIIRLTELCSEYEQQLSEYQNTNTQTLATETDATSTDADTNTVNPINLHNDKELMKENGVVMVIPDKIELEEVEEVYVSEPSPIQEPTQQYYSTTVLTASGGVNYYGEQKETYYNLNMDQVVANAQAQGIQGQYWVREDGVKMYGNYVIVAADLNVHPRGSTVETSLGTGIVLDTGGFAAENPTQVDIATNW